MANITQFPIETEDVLTLQTLDTLLDTDILLVRRGSTIYSVTKQLLLTGISAGLTIDEIITGLEAKSDDDRLDASAIKNLPSGFSGAYADLTGKPFIPVIDHEIGTFTFPSSGNPNSLGVAELVITNQNNPAQRRIYLRPPAGYTDYVGFHWAVGFVFEVGEAVITLASHSVPPSKQGNEYQGHFTFTGTLPAQGATGIIVRVAGDVPAESDLATVAKTGAYADLSGKPNIPTLPDLTLYVKRSDLEAHENDLFYNAQGATAFLSAGTTDKQGGFTVCTDGTTQPGTGDGVNWTNIVDGNYRFAVGRGRTDRDGNAGFNLGPALDAADYPIGKVIHMQPWQPYQSKAYAKLTLLTAGILVGTGSAAYVWFRATVDEVGNIEDGSDYWKITDLTPSTLDMDIPVDAVAGAMKTDMSNAGDISTAGRTKIAAAFARTSLSNISGITTGAAQKIRDALRGVIDNAFRAAVQSPADPYTFASNYTRKAGVTAKGQLAFASTPVLNGQQVQLTIGFQDVDESPATSRWITHNEFVWGSGRYRIVGSATPFQSNYNQYQAAVVLIEGTVDAIDSSQATAIEPDNPHRNELASIAFQSNVPSASYRYPRSSGGSPPGTVWDTPITDLSPTLSEADGRRHPTAQAVKDYIPQYGQVQEIRTYALPQDSWTIVPSNNSAATGQSVAITPRSVDSKFRIYTNIHLGSLNNGTRIEVRIARKIGTGNWGAVVDKDYVLYTGSTYNGAMDLSFGPYVDDPDTTDEVSYRIQLRRHGTPAANVETAFVEVTEVI